MLIGLGALISAVLPLVIVSFSATLWFLGRRNVYSAEAEYRVVAHAVAECCWLRQLLQELHVPLSKATLAFCDNVSVVYMAANPY
jgi:hypothetical protein